MKTQYFAKDISFTQENGIPQKKFSLFYLLASVKVSLPNSECFISACIADSKIDKNKSLWETKVKSAEYLVTDNDGDMTEWLVFAECEEKMMLTLKKACARYCIETAKIVQKKFNKLCINEKKYDNRAILINEY